MKRIRPVAFAVTLIACAPLAAQTYQTSDVWRKFYARLAGAARGGHRDPNMMLCLGAPGLPLKPLDSGRAADVAYLNELLDREPAYGPAYAPGRVPFSRIWGDVLQLHKADLLDPLTPGEQAEYGKALQQSRPGSSTVNKYNKYEADYAGALFAREVERWENLAKGSGFTNQPNTNAKVSEAKDRWLTEGRKSFVAAARNLTGEYAGRDPGPWWKHLAEDYRDARAGNAYRVATFPPMNQWAADAGWVKFSFKASDSRSPERFNALDVRAAQGLKINGFTGPGAGTGYEVKKIYALLTDPTLEITMELKRVFIYRAWVDWQVFVNDKWTWGNGVVSDEKGGGTLPLYADSFILARRVKFKARSIEASRPEMMQEIRANPDGGFGPFALAVASSAPDIGAREDPGVIELPSPQILAYCCSIVPKCPARTVK